MNPAFELDQVRRYITHLQQNPSLLQNTVETHFFPVLQRIFFREGLEVRTKQYVNNKLFPFVLIDLDLRKPNIAVDFSFQNQPYSQESTIPSFAHEWAERLISGEYKEYLLILRDYPLAKPHAKQLEKYNNKILFLDFNSLKDYATRAFDSYTDRQQQRATILIIDLLDKLIEAIAEEQVSLEELHWHDIERLFYRLLQGLGFHAHITPSSKDGGRDVLACDISNDDVHWYNIEIKHWPTRKVGRSPAQKILQTALKEGRRGALLLSTSGVSDDAIRIRTEIHQDYLRFGDGAKLVASCKHYKKVSSGLWVEHNTLRSFLFSGTK